MHVMSSHVNHQCPASIRSYLTHTHTLIQTHVNSTRAKAKGGVAWGMPSLVTMKAKAKAKEGRGHGMSVYISA
ncbi:hypothetical protein VTN00DRAFT_1513 [Thermoascus crustaceus]|uniref:uncharacterized protein n=1 Tax=Thermoascus crustaceus TaxID=5088 RepID=UPI0037437C9C